MPTATVTVFHGQMNRIFAAVQPRWMARWDRTGGNGCGRVLDLTPTWLVVGSDVADGGGLTIGDAVEISVGGENGEAVEIAAVVRSRGRSFARGQVVYGLELCCHQRGLFSLYWQNVAATRSLTLVA